MSKRDREQGSRCSRMPGECFDTEKDADEMRLTRQVNVAIGGMGSVVYQVRPCRCGKFHLMTDEHLKKWEAARRATRAERRRNA